MLSKKSKISTVELLKNSLVSQDFSEAISEFSSSDFISPFLEFAKLESEEDARLKAQELLDIFMNTSELNTQEAYVVVGLLLKNNTELGGNVLHALIYDARFSPANQLAVIEVLFNSSTFSDRLLDEKDNQNATPIDVFKQFLDKDFDGFAEIGLMALDHDIHVPDFLHCAIRQKNNDLVAAIYCHPHYITSGDEQVMYLVHREKFKEFYPAFATDEWLKEIKSHSREHAELIANALIEKGAKLNAKDFEGHTPLHYSISRGYTETVKALIAAGAQVNTTDRDGKTPLYVAAYWGYTETVKALITAGAQVNTTDKNGKTPLYVAASGCETEIVKALIENGAIPTEELRQLVIQKKQRGGGYGYNKEAYIKILELFDEFFTQQKLKAALNIQGSTSSNMLGSAAVTDDPNGAIVNLTEGVTAMFINQLSESKSAETGKGV